MFYIFKDEKYYLVINEDLTVSRTKNINRASYWRKKWEAIYFFDNFIIKRYPLMKLHEAVLTLK